jgi:hypothetical protein
MLSFHDLEMKFGPALAYQFLVEIEKAARIEAKSITGLDPETRLANACRAQDAMVETILAA